MQAVVKSRPEPGVDYVADRAVPIAGAGEVLVRVAATSLCGVDRHVYDWNRSGRAFTRTLPVIPGHETAGEINAVGEGVTSFREGDRVALESHLVCHECFECRTGHPHLCTHQEILGLTRDGAFAEYVAVPATACFRIPDEVPFDQAALFEPAGVAVHAVQRAPSLVGKSVLVTGCGPIGLFLIQLAVCGGAATVIGAEINPSRRRMAEKAGAATVDPGATDVATQVRAMTSGHRGVDVVFEASGAPRALLSALEAVRVAGDVVTVGHPGVVALDVSRLINIKYVTLRGVFGRRLWDTWETLSELVRADRIDLGSSISQVVALHELPSAIPALGDAGKVIVVPCD